jgi:HEAT repeat protein
MVRYILLLVLLISGNTVALKVTLDNGATYEGKVISENLTSYTIAVGNMPVTILKKMVVEVDGVRVKGPDSSASSSTTVSAPQDYKGKSISVTLKSGRVFQGTVISDNGKIIVLSNDGAPVNIYHSTIARIDNTGVAPPAAKGTIARQDSVPAKASQQLSSSKAVSSGDSKSSSITVTSLASESVPPSKAPSNQSSETNAAGKPAAAQSQGATTREPVFYVNESSTKSTTNAGKQTADTGAAVPGGAIALKAASEDQKSIGTIYIPPVRTRDDGLREIVLKNGSVFLGRILSENDRFISFDSNGASMNVMKKMIKEIDGVPYKDESAQKKQQDKSGKNSQMVQRISDFTGKRKLPNTPVPPDLTTDKLLDSLRSPFWETRSRACRISGSMGDWAHGSVSVLAVMLADTAQSKITVPVWIDSTDLQKLLAPSLEAARALAYLGDDGYQALKDALKSPDVLVRRSEVFGLLEFTGDSKGSVLKAMLNDKEPSVRALALGSFGNAQGEDHLLKALNDNEAYVRSNASFLLGKIRSEKSVPQLQLLLDDSRSLVRGNAIEALGLIGHINVSDKMIKLLEDPNFIVREKAVTALGRLQDTTAIWPVINSLRDVNPDVRAAAATALSYMRDPRAIPSLYALLKDDNLAVRERARESLRLHTELGQLIVALTDANVTVRENAAYVLWLLTGKDYGEDREKWIAWYQQEYKTNR